MKNIYIIFLCALFNLQGFSQSEGWVRTFGSADFNYGKRVCVLRDTTYLLLCNKSGFISANNVYVVSADRNGMLLWDKVYGDENLFNASDICSIGDSLFGITGICMTSTSDEYDFFYLLIAKSGEVRKKIVFPSSGWNSGNAIISDVSGNIYFATDNKPEGQKEFLRILKTDIDGNILAMADWQTNAQIKANSMCLYSDSLVYVAGNRIVEDETQQGFILKLTKNLEILDSLLFGPPDFNYSFEAITETFSGNIAIAGMAENVETGNYQNLQVMIDTNNQIIQESIKDGERERFNSVTAAFFGDFIAYTGGTYFLGGGDLNVSYNIDHFTDYFQTRRFGGPHDEEAFDCGFALDSTLVIIGITDSYGPHAQNILFMKTAKDYSHNIDNYVHITSTEENQAKQNFTFSIFPNPAMDYIKIEALPDNQIQVLCITDVHGKTILTNPAFSVNHGLLLNISNLGQGMYFLKLRDNKGQYIVKILKI